ncbi:MAG: hypothetical protein AB7P04_09100 [Bacteriovoracia bacterium]
MFFWIESAHGFRAGPQPELVNHLPREIFVPTSFDDNDFVQIVVAGEYANTCFKVAASEVTVDPDRHRILIRDQAYFFQNCFCLFVLVPYDKVIPIGLLAKGNHDLFFDDGRGNEVRMGSIQVAAARKSTDPDEHLYAPVEGLTVLKRRKTHQVELRGHYPNTCLAIQETRVVHRNPKVVEILPIMKMAVRDDCEAARVPFVVKAALPEGLEGRTLIHVRALNGKSIDQLHEF